jgi:hypothetical protein
MPQHRSMPSEHSKPGPITHQAAHTLAAKLRAAGVYTSGKDVLTWRFETVRRALTWAYKIHGLYKAQTFAEFMGADAPPPSPQSWLPLSAGSQDGDRAGS